MKLVGFLFIPFLLALAAPAFAGDKIPPAILADRHAETSGHHVNDVALIQGDGVHELVVRFKYWVRDSFIALLPVPGASRVTTANPAFFTQLQSYVEEDTLRSLWGTMIPDHIDPEGSCISWGRRFPLQSDRVLTPGFCLAGSQVFSPSEDERLLAWCAERGVSVEANHGKALAAWRTLGYSVVAMEFVSPNIGPPVWRSIIGDERTEPVRIRFEHPEPFVPGGRIGVGILYSISDEPVFPHGLPTYAAAVRILNDEAAAPRFGRFDFRLAPIPRYGVETQPLSYSLLDDIHSDADFPWLRPGEASLTIVQFGDTPLGFDHSQPFNCQDIAWAPWDPAGTIQDSTLNTRAAAAVALGMNKIPEAPALLTRFLQTANQADQSVAAAMWALGQQGPDGQEELLARWGGSDNMDIRDMVAACYAVIRNEAAWEYLAGGYSYRGSDWLRILRDPAALPALRRRHVERLNQEFEPNDIFDEPPPRLRRGLFGLLAACGDQEAWSEIRTDFLEKASRVDGTVAALNGKLLQDGNGYDTAGIRSISPYYVHDQSFDGLCAELIIRDPARVDMIRELAHSGELPRSCTLELLANLRQVVPADEDLLRRIWRQAPLYREGTGYKGMLEEKLYDRTALACLTEFGRCGMVEDLWNEWKRWRYRDPVVAEIIVRALGRTDDPRVFSALRVFMSFWWDSVLVPGYEQEMEEALAQSREREIWPRWEFMETFQFITETEDIRRLMVAEVEDEDRSVLWRLAWLEALGVEALTPEKFSQLDTLLTRIESDPEADTPVLHAAINRIRDQQRREQRVRIQTKPPWEQNSQPPQRAGGSSK